MNNEINKVKIEVNKEIEMLNKAVELATNARYFRYESFTRALEAVGFPYRLVQSWERGVRGNLYSWSGDWSKGALYIQETKAGTKRVHGIQAAINVLREVMEVWA